MSKQIDRISRKLREAGACYAHSDHKHISPNDPGTMSGDAKPSYHILPDRDNPYQTSILRFPSLDTLESWADMRIAALAMEPEQAEELHIAWYDAHDLA